MRKSVGARRKAHQKRKPLKKNGQNKNDELGPQDHAENQQKRSTGPKRHYLGLRGRSLQTPHVSERRDGSLLSFAAGILKNKPPEGSPVLHRRGRAAWRKAKEEWRIPPQASLKEQRLQPPHGFSPVV